MPVKSQYSDEQYNAILEQLISVLEQNNVKTDQSLMLLGDAITHIFNQRIAPDVRKQLASQFCDVLKRTIED